MKKLALAAIAASLVALGAYGETPGATASAAGPDDPIVASINGEILTRSQLNDMYAKLSPEMRENYERSGGKVQFLDYYIRKRLVVQEALKSGFDKKSSVLFDLQQARDGALFDRYIRDVVASSIVSEADLRAYYESNIETFRRPELIKARHIIATSAAGNVVNQSRSDAKSKEEALEKMTKIAQQLHSNAAGFADLAVKYSEDGSAPEGGDLGWFPRGRMIPEFEDAAFALDKGKISHVVETEFGYHVILVEDRKPAGVASFEEVRRDIRERLLTERMDKILAEVNRLASELRGASQISVNRENF